MHLLRHCEHYLGRLSAYASHACVSAAASTTALPEALGSFTFGSSGLRRGEDGAHHFTITTGNTTTGPGLHPMSAEVWRDSRWLTCDRPHAPHLLSNSLTDAAALAELLFLIFIFHSWCSLASHRQYWSQGQ